MFELEDLEDTAQAEMSNMRRPSVSIGSDMVI